MYSAPTAITGTNAIPLSGVYAFQVLQADTRIASITINGTDFTSWSDCDLPVGTIIYGVITSITLSQGKGIAYAGSNLL